MPLSNAHVTPTVVASESKIVSLTKKRVTQKWGAEQLNSLSIITWPAEYQDS
jgi:hypothetical protein